MRGTNRTTALVAMALLASSAAACTGPRDPLAVGVREVASDILIGGGGPAAEVPTTPLPPTTVAVTVPIALPPPIPSIRPPRPRPTSTSPSATPTPTPTPTEVQECREADPLSSPALESSQDVAVAPPLATFSYRNVGEFEIGGANAQIGIFGGNTERTVTEVIDTSNGFDYAIEAELGGTVTRTAYRVVNVGPAADVLTGIGRDEDVGRGLSLVQVTSTDADGAVSQFTPQPPITLLPFPAITSTTFQSAGTDPLTGTTMSFDGIVVGKERIDACGEYIDAIRVEVTNGRIVGPATNVTFAAIYDHATQYGGMTVHDLFEVNGTEGGIPIFRRNDATINAVPEPSEAS